MDIPLLNSFTGCSILRVDTGLKRKCSMIFPLFYLIRNAFSQDFHKIFTRFAWYGFWMDPNVGFIYFQWIRRRRIYNFDNSKSTQFSIFLYDVKYNCGVCVDTSRLTAGERKDISPSLLRGGIWHLEHVSTGNIV